MLDTHRNAKNRIKSIREDYNNLDPKDRYLRGKTKEAIFAINGALKKLEDIYDRLSKVMGEDIERFDRMSSSYLRMVNIRIYVEQELSRIEDVDFKKSMQRHIDLIRKQEEGAENLLRKTVEASPALFKKSIFQQLESVLDEMILKPDMKNFDVEAIYTGLKFAIEIIIPVTGPLVSALEDIRSIINARKDHIKAATTTNAYYEGLTGALSFWNDVVDKFTNLLLRDK